MEKETTIKCYTTKIELPSFDKINRYEGNLMIEFKNDKDISFYIEKEKGERGRKFY